MADRVQIKSSTKGYKRGAVFDIQGLGAWEQSSSQYEYRYQYRPEATFERNGSRGKLKIDGHDNWIDVKRHRPDED
jgi:hypothetical protein